MTVAELIEELKRLPQDVPVYSEEAYGAVSGVIVQAWFCQVINKPAVVLLNHRMGILK